MKILPASHGGRPVRNAHEQHNIWPAPNRSLTISERGSEAGPRKRARGIPFLDTLNKTLDQAQQIQGEADTKVANLLNGKGSEDVQSVMTAVEKADLSFQLVMQVRNKIVQAYRDVAGLQF